MEIISPHCSKSQVNKYKQLIHQNTNDYSDLNEQNQIEFEDDIFQEDNFQPSFFLKLFFSYLYFTQGLVLALSSTIPYIYPELPSYDIMAIFTASTLPYSFKFIIAPIIQKYTYFKYGKRKFWIIISQIISSSFIIVSSFYTDQKESNFMAFFLLFSNFFMTFQDISLDSLAKKELRHPHIAGMISSVYQLIGSILGSMLLLKLTSSQFAHYFSLDQPILSISSLIKLMGFLMLLPTCMIHFLFRQTPLLRQYKAIQISLFQVFYSYKAFFICKGKYFRTIIYFLIVNQGFNFFLAGYDYQLVKAGFSRDINNTISNIVTIPVAILMCLFTSKIQPFGIKRGLVVAILGQIFIYGYLRIFFPLNVYAIAITSFGSSMFNSWIFMIGSILIYQFPLHSFSGMFITFLASASNLGNAQTIHTKILSYVSWWTMSIIGLVLELLILGLLYFYLLDWKDEGVVDVEQILQNKNYSKEQLQEQSQNQDQFNIHHF